MDYDQPCSQLHLKFHEPAVCLWASSSAILSCCMAENVNALSGNGCGRTVRRVRSLTILKSRTPFRVVVASEGDLLQMKRETPFLVASCYPLFKVD